MFVSHDSGQANNYCIEFDSVFTGAMPDYGEHKYWETRYKTSLASIPVFDWYNDYDAVKTVLAPLLKRKEVSTNDFFCAVLRFILILILSQMNCPTIQRII